MDVRSEILRFCEIDSIYDYLYQWNCDMYDETEIEDDDVKYDLKDYNFARFYVKYRFEKLKNRFKHGLDGKIHVDISTYFINCLDKNEIENVCAKMPFVTKES